jgi:LysM repeat protein
MSKTMLLTQAGAQESATGRFVSSFSINNNARNDFNAYKNSLTSDIYQNSRVSVSNLRVNNSLKSVDPQRVRSLKTSPLFLNKNTRFSSEVRRKMMITFLVATSFLVVLIPASQAFGGLTLGSTKSSAAETQKQNVSTIVVKSGDTLWSIAQTLEPKTDPRIIVDKLIESRGTTNLMVGETIEWTK